MEMGTSDWGIPQRITADSAWDRVWRVGSEFSVLAAADLIAWSCGDGTTDPPEINNAPVASGTIPFPTVYVGNTATLRLSRCFNDPDGDALTYTAQSTTPLWPAIRVA